MQTTRERLKQIRASAKLVRDGIRELATFDRCRSDWMDEVFSVAGFDQHFKRKCCEACFFLRQSACCITALPRSGCLSPTSIASVAANIALLAQYSSSSSASSSPSSSASASSSTSSSSSSSSPSASFWALRSSLAAA